MRRILLAVFGLMGSCSMLALLVMQQLPDSFRDTALHFQPTQSPAVQLQEISQGATENTPVYLPLAVSGTYLIAEKLISYDGPFLEDGTGCEVTNLAALLLRNTGQKGISSARVIVEQAGRKLIFEATQIPPGSAVLVLENSGNLYSQDALTDCYGWVCWETAGWQLEGPLRLEPIDMGSLWVTNATEAPLEAIRLYYKTDYGDGLFYLGGITYEIYIDNLEAGERILLEPDHYAGTSTKFVRVQYRNQ